MAVNVNDNFGLIQNNYLFVEIARRVEEYQKANPDVELIKMGIGDVTRPLAKTVLKAFHDAVDELGQADTFRGYGPEQGYDFLIEDVIKNDYNTIGVELKNSEVFISDGAKCDTGNFQELFSADNTIAVTDPVYPVYVDSNVMAGRSGKMGDDGFYENIVYLPCTEENDFVPALPEEDVDIIYLCYPNNPTGTTLTKDQLKEWVDYAHEHDALILFDAAYESFIKTENVPHSIFEIEGAKEVAVEFRSYSKVAGFTGTRCAYCVVPEEVYVKDSEGNDVQLNPLWNRRQSTKFNGVSYPVQRAAQAIYTEEGKKEIQENLDYYVENAKVIREGLEKIGLHVYGGVDSPYIWFKTPNDIDSWSFFDILLNDAHVVSTPGAGFGPSGEGYIRLTSFNTYENTVEAMERISKLEF
ncbi:LL-diaminopimelate aminotransferase [Methanosphaera sp. WGK6]|uniref:LL-diaminopimelate aminotransferase n=1 Tax=Methanosphaera sp. WGK6 TaxID=1561964 RepID=UPI00084CC3E8|nr:LL-diaminopimelate aminotransferase [Methanosphaera sp. WGK6]OED29811.1 L,L-diaminopimelate aminotransferase [Methanosphaera sp. WGK6]